MNASKVTNAFKGLQDRNMPAILVLCRVSYGIIFLVSGILKLSDLPSFAISVDAFRVVPPDLVPFVEFTIPIAEVMLGICLIWGLVTALMSFFSACMLAVFSGLIAEKLVEGARISCGCFGSLSAEPLTGATLVRNIVLGAWAALLTSISVHGWRPSEVCKGRLKGADGQDMVLILSTVGGHIRRTGGYCIVLFVLGITSMLGFQNIALKNRLAMVVDDQVLTLGDVVPGFRARGLDSAEVQIEYNDPNIRTLLLLFSVQCNPCKENLVYWDEIAKVAHKQKRWRVIGISLSSLENSRKFVASRSFGYKVLVANDPAFRHDYKAYLTPLTLVVDSIGRVDVVWAGVLNPEASTKLIQVVRSGETKVEKFDKVSNFVNKEKKVPERVP